MNKLTFEVLNGLQKETIALGVEMLTIQDEAKVEELADKFTDNMKELDAMVRDKNIDDLEFTKEEKKVVVRCFRLLVMFTNFFN